MELTTDVMLRGTAWSQVIDSFSLIFKTRTHYMLYLLSMSIGIMYDQRIDKPDEAGEEPRSVPRNVLRNNDNGKLDFMFQAAILSTETEDIDENTRLELAFGENIDYNKIGLLTQFANYGITKLVELIGNSPVESMENIKNFLASTVEGRNLDVDTLPDDILLADDAY